MNDADSIRFYVHDADGNIVQSGFCARGDFDKQSVPNATVRVGDGAFGVHYVRDGELHLIGDQPSPLHRFSAATGWTLDVVLVAAQRNRLLVASDWASLPDVPMTPEKRSEWAAYRQALRDITDQPGYPLEVVWPVQPE